MTCLGARAQDAWRNRAVSFSWVVVFLLATHASFPDAGVRASVQYLFVVTLGYGHLLGAAVLPRSLAAPASARSPRAFPLSFQAVTAA